uniref:EF-hand domain-containing protein n=1 Tax=uncultured marine group II/III euryarchaeote KM3_37_D11 TaxID=1456443 RepID=A0A075H6H6_9EURY|nr:hypothetical protein [uncultured marine group II/III euryarchaeote KM3_37_D11]
MTEPEWERVPIRTQLVVRPFLFLFGLLFAGMPGYFLFTVLVPGVLRGEFFLLIPLLFTLPFLLVGATLMLGAPFAKAHRKPDGELHFGPLPQEDGAPAGFFGRTVGGIGNALIGHQLLARFDRDRDSRLSREEFATLCEQLAADGQLPGDFDAERRFREHDQNSDGYLDASEAGEMMRALLWQLGPADGVPQAAAADHDRGSRAELEKLERLHRDGFISTERFERLKQDLAR